MSIAEYHIHVNGLGSEVPEITQELAALGFKYKAASIYRRNEPRYFGLYSYKAPDSAVRDDIFERALSVIRGNPSFIGYVESESVAEEMDVTFEYRPYDGAELLLPQPVMVKRPKKGDVHLYLPVDQDASGLDAILSALNFFEVRTATKRIFTIETESFGDAKSLFKFLSTHFESHGGVLEVECETVGNLKPARADFEFRKVVARGYAARFIGAWPNRDPNIPLGA